MNGLGNRKYQSGEPRPGEANRGLVEFTPQTARRHAPLVQRVSAIVTALGSEPSLRLRDSAETLPAMPNCACITLQVCADDSAGEGLTRDGDRRFTLRYRDGGGDAALGALVAGIAAVSPGGAPIACDPESLSVLALAERLAASEIPVLINGPTGTGKEVLSRFIHDRSPRAAGPFVAVNCAAMPETMLEALLFGHQKGAFTGATQASEGFFRAADGGTLLLDEIAEMPLALQAKLLRALQEGEVVPIGATQAIKIDVRVLAAANRDLPTEVAEGRFRADLYYRLNVFPLALRPTARKARRYCRAGLRHAAASHPGGPAGAVDRRGGDRAAAPARLAGQCPRAGKRHAPRAAAHGLYRRRGDARRSADHPRAYSVRQHRAADRADHAGAARVLRAPQAGQYRPALRGPGDRRNLAGLRRQPQRRRAPIGDFGKDVALSPGRLP